MRAIKLLLKLFLVLAVIALLPVFAWWIYNRFDEKSTPAAAKLAEPFPHDVPDRENAWLMLIGLGAPEAEDPIAFGRRRVDTFNARLAKIPSPPADEAEKALFEDAVPLVGPEKTGSTAGVCGYRTPDCIAWAAQHVDMLAKLRTDNALRQKRYAQMLGMTRFDELFTPDLDEHDMTLGDDSIYHNLLAAELAAGGDAAAVFDRMLRAAQFWQRVDEQAISPLMKALAGVVQERYWRLQYEALSGPAAGRLAQLREKSNAILRAQPHDFDPMLKYEFQLFDRGMRSVMAGSWSPLQCYRKGEKDCLKNLAIAQAYEHQATLNIRASLASIQGRALAAEAPAQAAAFQEAGVDLEMFMPIGDYEKSVRFLRYNGTGQVLAFISLPARGESTMLYDREALRRMFVIALDALAAHVAPAAMDAYLAGLPATLRNPYTSEPFGWDAQTHELHFAPQSKKWNSERVAVRVPAPAAPPARDQRPGSKRARSA